MEQNDLSNLPTTQTATTNEEVVAVKRNAWANLGEKTHNVLLELTTESTEIKTGLPMPQTIEGINATEAALKVAKQKTNQLVLKRKSVTSLIDSAFSKLMAPEKDLTEVYIPSIEKKLIELKREKKTADDLAQVVTDEKRRLKEAAIKYINDYDLLFKQEINKKCAGALEYALGVGNVTAEGLEKYLEECRKVFKPLQFITPMQKVTLNKVTHDEFVAIWDEVKTAIKEPAHYVGTETSLFEMELKQKFEFYDAALLNKAGAIEQNKNIEAKNNEELQKQNASANISATLQGMATASTATVKGNETKALKQKFELDMIEDEANALVIITAFVSSLDMARQYVKAGWFKLSVAQMGAALVAIKNADNKFEFTGIKFKLVDKL